TRVDIDLGTSQTSGTLLGDSTLYGVAGDEPWRFVRHRFPAEGACYHAGFQPAWSEWLMHSSGGWEGAHILLMGDGQLSDTSTGYSNENRWSQSGKSITLSYGDRSWTGELVGDWVIYGDDGGDAWSMERIPAPAEGDCSGAERPLEVSTWHYE